MRFSRFSVRSSMRPNVYSQLVSSAAAMWRISSNPVSVVKQSPASPPHHPLPGGVPRSAPFTIPSEEGMRAKIKMSLMVIVRALTERGCVLLPSLEGWP